jgi:hypothetical protein
MPIILIKITEFSPYSLSTTKRFVKTSENKKFNLHENGHLAEKISAWQPWREKHMAPGCIGCMRQ